MKVQFCGAAQFVTGSSHLITLDNGYKILLDCGLYQGSDKDQENFNRKWLFNPASLDCVILSHAHIDHCGRLPKLVKDGFNGNIFSTHATRSLCAIMLLDSAYIQEKDAEYHNKKQKKKPKKDRKFVDALYRTRDVKPTMDLFFGLPYNRWTPINEDVDLLFKDAGHILGSASVTLRIRENGSEHYFGFSGDIGRPNRPILRDPKPMPECDYLICESTYGDRLHDSKPHEHKVFKEIIENTCVKNKGKLIIPAFSVGRTQEIVYMMDQMATNNELPKIPVYVDSPLAVNATQVFGSHPECYDNDLNEYLLIDENPFGFNDLTYIRKVEQSKQLNDSDEPCVIISASGMMTAGRIRHHVYNHIEDPTTTILIVGYCTPDSLGGILLSGVEEVKLFGEIVQVNATIQRMNSFSAHADQLEMLEFIRNQRSLKQLFLVHGESDVQKAFAKKLNHYGWDHVSIPTLGEEYEL